MRTLTTRALISIQAVIGCVALAGAAQAQNAAIWIQCERVPASATGRFTGAFEGVWQIGEGLMRRYDPSTRMLETNGCDGGARCTLTADEFTHDYSPGLYRLQGRIDRRTGQAQMSLNHFDSPEVSGSNDSICRGTTDPRPAARF